MYNPRISASLSPDINSWTKLISQYLTPLEFLVHSGSENVAPDEAEYIVSATSDAIFSIELGSVEGKEKYLQASIENAGKTNWDGSW